MTLPTYTQFLKAKGRLTAAAEFALLALCEDREDRIDNCKRACIKDLQAAAEALGFEIVQPVPNSMREAG